MMRDLNRPSPPRGMGHWQLGSLEKRPMTGDTVLVVTTSYDSAPEYVLPALEGRGVPYFRLDTDRFPTEIHASFMPRQGVTLEDGGRSITGSDVKSVWYRRNVAPNLPDHLDVGTREFCERETRAFLEGTLASIQTKRWLSSPQAIWGAERKPYQLAVAAALGFTLPSTLVTNDEVALRGFAQDRKLVAKAVGSGYIQAADGFYAIFTSALDPAHLSDLSGLTLAPVTFQEHVEKSRDIRVTVVGNEVFAAEILSQSRESSRVDWRATDDPDLEHRPHEVPSTLARLCVSLVSHLGLAFGALDFALTPEGSYVFFEINPNGEWLWLEDQLGLPISDRIAAWLSA